jgi:Bacteriophage Mu Gam like protein
MESTLTTKTEERAGALPLQEPNYHSETRKAEEFAIDTRDRAEWYLRKLAEMEGTEARIMAQAEAMLKRLRSDRERFTGRFAAQFESFTRGELAQQKGSRRSVLYFNGTAQFTAVAPRLVVASEADAITTARAVKPDAVTEETITKLDKKAFLAYASERFNEVGELLPGIERTEAGERFSVKFNTKEEEQEAP